MKDILFRGFTTDGRYSDSNTKIIVDGESYTGIWVYGNLIVNGDYCCILQPDEALHPMDQPYLDPFMGSIHGYATPVIPSTVGMFTGEYDKNGKRIFEHDIVDMDGEWWDAYGPAGHGSRFDTVTWSEGFTGFNPFMNYDCDCGVYIDADGCSVIGNVFENPDILEMSDEEIVAKYVKENEK